MIRRDTCTTSTLREGLGGGGEVDKNELFSDEGRVGGSEYFEHLIFILLKKIGFAPVHHAESNNTYIIDKKSSF